MPSSVSTRGRSRSRPTCQRGVPAFAIVGLPGQGLPRPRNGQVGNRERRFRVPAPSDNIDSSPARLRKEGLRVRPAIALAIYAASQQIPPEFLAEHAAVGELALDGRLRPVPGRSSRPKRPGGRDQPPPLPSQSPPPRRRWRSSRYRCATWPRPAPTSGGRAGPRRARSVDLLERRRPGPRGRAGASAPAGRFEIVATEHHNLLFAGRPAPGGPCSRGGCRRPPAADARPSLEATRIQLHRRACSPPTTRSSPVHPSGRRTTRLPLRLSSGASTRPPPARSASHHGVLLLDELAKFHRPHPGALRQPLEGPDSRRRAAAGRRLSPAGPVRPRRHDEPAPAAPRRPRPSSAPARRRSSPAYGMKLYRALLDRFDLVVRMPTSRPPARTPGRRSRRPPVRRPRRRGRQRLREAARGSGVTRAPCSAARCRHPAALGARARPRITRFAATIAARSPARPIEPHVAEACSYRVPPELSQ